MLDLVMALDDKSEKSATKLRTCHLGNMLKFVPIHLGAVEIFYRICENFDLLGALQEMPAVYQSHQGTSSGHREHLCKVSS